MSDLGHKLWPVWPGTVSMFISNKKDMLVDVEELGRRVHEGLKQYNIFSPVKCEEIERNIEQLVVDMDKGKYKACSVDRSRLRNK